MWKFETHEFNSYEGDTIPWPLYNVIHSWNVIKLLKCKINLTLICYIIPRKLTISSDIKAIRIHRN